MVKRHKCRAPHADAPAIAAFTLTELLVVIAILTLLAATQLPALTGGKAPIGFTQCMNNLRQIGQATMLYKNDNNDAFPFGNRILGPGTGPGSVVDPTGWPMQLLHYSGGYQTNVQPGIFFCPGVKDPPLPTWSYQLHYTANRNVVSDVNDLPAGIRGYQIRRPATYWMFMDKNPGDIANARAGALATILTAWNIPPGTPGYRRHDGGVSTVACDGRVEWLRTPPYQPGAPAPQHFGELGDTSDGSNPASTWNDSLGPRKKLYCRKWQSSSGGIAF